MLLERPEKFSYEIFLSSRRGEGCHSMFYSRASIRADTYLLLLVCIAQWRPQKVYRSKSSVLLVELQMKHNSWTDRKQIAQFFYCCVFRSKEYNYSVGVVLWFAVLKQGVCKENKHTFFFFFFSTGLHEYLDVNASFANAAMHSFTVHVLQILNLPSIKRLFKSFWICSTTFIVELKCLSRLRKIVEQCKHYMHLIISIMHFNKTFEHCKVHLFRRLF